ncbi:MAG TPA: hypothetical protein VGP28_12835 [Methylocella sp.]|nr:hypothetical protein [Methylocella sp.]
MLAPCERLGDPAREVRYWRRWRNSGGSIKYPVSTLLKFKLGHYHQSVNLVL